MKQIKIGRYLPDTVSNSEQTCAVEMKALLDEMAKDLGSTVTKFEIVEGGVAIVGFSTEDVLEKIADQFKELDGVKVETLSTIQIQYEQNRAHQKQVDGKRATKAAKKKPVEDSKK
jgi:hypothetical protein